MQLTFLETDILTSLLQAPELYTPNYIYTLPTLPSNLCVSLVRDDDAINKSGRQWYSLHASA
jgi:hypothetical protein